MRSRIARSDRAMISSARVSMSSSPNSSRNRMSWRAPTSLPTTWEWRSPSTSSGVRTLAAIIA